METRLITGALLVEVVVLEVLMPGEAKLAICVSTWYPSGPGLLGIFQDTQPCPRPSDSTLIKFGVAILTRADFILMFFGSEFESQTSALSAHICPAKELKYPQRKRERDAWPFASPSVNCRTTVFSSNSFSVSKSFIDPPTLRPIKMSFPQNTSYIALILPIF